MKVVFRNEENEDLFVVSKNEAKNFVLPRVGEDVIWMKLFLTVKSITHNYDAKQIEIDCEIA